MKTRRPLTKAEQSFCADPKNLPALRARWHDAVYKDRRDEDDAGLLLETALWWHRDKLIEAYMRAQLRLVA